MTKLAADKECEVYTMEWSDVQEEIRSMQGCEMNSNRLSAPVYLKIRPVVIQCALKTQTLWTYNGFHNREEPVYYPGVMTHLVGFFPSRF